MSEVVEKRDVHRPLLFECAWEVANKGERREGSAGMGQPAHVAHAQSAASTLSSRQRHR